MPTASRPSRTRIVLFGIAVAVVLLWKPAASHLRAAELLARVSDPGGATGRLGKLGATPVDETETTFQVTSGVARARIYAPRDAKDPPGLVIVHGVHRLGMEEPRLIRFARAIAASGIRVLTPEVRELADYRVDPASIDTIGQAARALRRDVTPRRAVGVMGLSFAGGLALLAAASPRFVESIDLVVAVGAHDDLARVSRFFATNSIERPDGTELTLRAHEYGPLVLVYSHIEDFFPAADVGAARDALRAWLWEKHDEARSKLAALGEPSRATMERLFDEHVEAIAPTLLAEIDRNTALMALVSPHEHLASVHAAIYLLHGAGDTVIPPSETLWLARDLPPGVVRRVLVSPAIGHVELGGHPSAGDEWAVVDFFAAVLAEVDATRR